MSSHTESKSSHGPPPAGVQKVFHYMQTLMLSKVVGFLTEAGIPDILANAGKPLSAAEIAKATGLNEEAIFRSMRIAASDDWFTESANGEFGLKEAKVLISGPGSVCDLLQIWAVCPSHNLPFLQIPETLRTGKLCTKTALGVENIWDWFATHEKEKLRFSRAMTNFVSMVAPLVAQMVDFKKFKTHADLGGSAGIMAHKIHHAHAHLKSISFDLPSLTADITKNNPLPGVEYAAGDFFQEVPAADVYTMSDILHDWSDEKCNVILKNIRKQMKDPEHDRLYVLDSVMPPVGDTSDSMTKSLDMAMLIIAGGKERTEVEWRKLFSDAGLELVKISPCGPNKLLEVRRTP